MMQKLSRSFIKHACMQSLLFLSLIWLSGIILGALLASVMKEHAVSLIAAAVNCRVSFLGLCAVLLLPVFISFISCKTSRRWPIFVLLFVKAISLGHSVLAMLWAYGNAAWLLHFLLSFSSALTLIPLFYLWVRMLGSDGRLSMKHIQWMCIFNISVGLVDYFLVSPVVLTL